MKFELGNFFLRGKEGQLYILESFLSGIYALMAFMGLVLNSTDTCYAAKEKLIKGWGTRPDRLVKQLILTALGGHVCRFADYAGIYSRQYKYHPAVAFFFEQYAQHRISSFPYLGMNARNADGETYAQVADDFIKVMRKEAVRAGLKKKIHNWQSRAVKNRERLETFLNALFGMCSRLMVVRVDLDYKEATFDAEDIDQFIVAAKVAHEADQAAFREWGVHRHQQSSASGTEAVLGAVGEDVNEDFPAPRVFTGRVALQQVKQDRQRFFAKLKDKERSELYKPLLGYAWRIDCAREAGFHLHVAFFFNGHDAKSHKYYAHELGMLWLDTVGEDRGYFYNCNLDEDKFERNGQWGIGMVEHDDLIKRTILLDDVLGYFVEAEKILQYVLEDESHMFGAIFVKKPTTETRGRPRRKRTQPPVLVS